MNEATLGFQQKLIGARPQWWLAAMLFALHFALAFGIENWPARGMLLAHFGLFLMWEAAWRGERSLEARPAVLVVAGGFLLAAWNSWWLMAVWLAVLFALIGGNLLGSPQPRQRLAAVLAALYLLSMLLLWVVPHLFVDQRLELAWTMMVQYGLQLLPLLIILVPAPARPRSIPLAVDLIYSLMLFLLVMGLVLGSFVVKQVNQGDYTLALAQALIGMALLLLTLSWLWNPRSSFTGIGHLLSHYLMSLGLPFERWVKELADLADEEREPARFLALALRNLCELPWVAGVAWHAPHGRGEVGRRSTFQAEFSFQDLTLAFYTKWSLSPALILHLKLLTQMLGHFYKAKQREEMQRYNAYTQAIYETGARLTHDVKNLLQTLRSLCAAAATSGTEQAPALQELIKRQLPQIAQRLTTTLDKLNAPAWEHAADSDAALWWEGLQQRYARGEIKFSDDGRMQGLMIPGELFDRVAENLLQNAIAKAQHHAGVRIDARFDSADGGKLAVVDDGKGIAATLERRLFLGPVPSQTGLGVGLYQAAKQAQQLGYKLTLAANAEGRVCFELARSAPSGELPRVQHAAVEHVG